MWGLEQRDNADDESEEDQTLERVDVSLNHWLNLLESFYSDCSPSAHEVFLRTIAASESSGTPSPMSMRTSLPDGYLPLNALDHEIRILVLYPNEDHSGDIVCETFNFNVKQFFEMGTERFPYLALSYVWGGPDTKKTIWFGREQKTVTLNLFEALQSLRDPFVPMLLWVDALCIDQGNPEEVKSQVGMMDVVYSGAGAVLAWISNQQNEHYMSSVAMELLTGLERLIDGVRYDVGQPSAKQPLRNEWKKLMASGYGPLEAFDQSSSLRISAMSGPCRRSFSVAMSSSAMVGLLFTSARFCSKPYRTGGGQYRKS